VGFRYLYPIASLLEQLLSLENRNPNEVQASTLENGYSCSIIVMCGLMIESAIARVKFDQDIEDPKSALQYVKVYFPEYERFDELEELFVIRDAIVHNHIWEAGQQVV